MPQDNNYENNRKNKIKKNNIQKNGNVHWPRKKKLSEKVIYKWFIQISIFYINLIQD